MRRETPLAGVVSWGAIRLVLLIVICVAALVLLVSYVSSAWPHSFYDKECCSGTDCAPASPGDVSWTPAGWEVKSLKETVPFSSTKLRHTPIGEPPFHECMWHGLLVCLYVPEPQS